MPDKFKNKFKNESNRMQYWDYSQGWYFITIISRNRVPYFGEIINGVVHLSDIGKIAESEWLKTPSIRPDMNIVLDEFVVMPDHFHGMIGLHGGDRMHDYGREAMHNCGGDRMHPVPTIKKNKFGPQSKNLAAVIGGFKSSVTTHARKMGLPFDWQTRFHDRAIRNADEFHRIRKYIRDNPANW